MKEFDEWFDQEWGKDKDTSPYGWSVLGAKWAMDQVDELFRQWRVNYARDLEHHELPPPPSPPAAEKAVGGSAAPGGVHHWPPPIREERPRVPPPTPRNPLPWDSLL